jgi:hypothetical protein
MALTSFTTNLKTLGSTRNIVPISSKFDMWVDSVSGRFGRLHNHILLILKPAWFVHIAKNKKKKENSFTTGCTSYKHPHHMLSSKSPRNLTSTINFWSHSVLVHVKISLFWGKCFGNGQNAEFYTIYPRASGGLQRTPCHRAPRNRGGRHAACLLGPLTNYVGYQN